MPRSRSQENHRTEGLNVVVIGCDERLLPDVRREAVNHRATIISEFPDLPRALNTCELSAAETALFVVYINSTDLPHLKRLSATYVGHPILALVDADKDASMILKAMRAGALQVVRVPLDREDFRQALDCISMQFGLIPARAKTIAVAGATGGCGATTIALNLGYELAWSKGVQSILIELSLRMGVLASHLDVQPRFTISDLLLDPVGVDTSTVNQALTPIIDNFSILPGPYQAIEPGTIRTADVMNLIELAGQLAPIVILDVPCTFDELYFKALSAADSVLLVAQQKVTSIRGAQLVCAALPELRPTIVVNRYSAKAAGFSPSRLRTLLRCDKVMSIADDPVVGAALDHGRPLRLQSPRAKALVDIGKLAHSLAPLDFEPKRAPERSNILGRLGRALSLT